MKRMKTILITLPLLALCGCMSATKLANAVGKNAANDHNTWIVKAETIYGKGEIIRVGDSANSVISVSDTGAVTQTPLKCSTNPIAK